MSKVTTSKWERLRAKHGKQYPEAMLETLV